MMRSVVLPFCLLTVPFFFIASCGGGGGGGATQGNPAAVSIEIAPRQIDSGDRVNVTLRIRDIRVFEFGGLIIKVLFPSSLEYVADSAVLETNDSTDETIAPTSAGADESTYLLFFIDTGDIDSESRLADITFVMEGTGRLEESTVAVDVDAADSDTRSTFDASNPQFTSLASTTVEVIDS